MCRQLNLFDTIVEKESNLRKNRNEFSNMNIYTGEKVQPFVKWAGGKRQLLPEIKARIPNEYGRYYEPFLGGGAVLLSLQPDEAIVNDFNSELISAYKVIKNNVEELIEDLKTHENNEDYFYDIRAKDREPEFENWSDVKIASRFIYLNKTCYNGLYRVNSKGFFNTPFAHYKNPAIVNEEVLRDLNDYFNKADITFLSTDFEKALESVESDDFVYFDPPYAPVSPTANYTSYTAEGFNLHDQERLRDLCLKLDEMGVKFLLSNANVDIVNELYDDSSVFNIEIVAAARAINSNGAKRGKVEEVLISNFE